MYSIIVFLDEDGDCEGVPSSWLKIVGGTTFCFWPKNSVDVGKLVRKAREPSSDWQLFKCIVKSTAETYEEMKEKREEALNVTTNYESSEDEEVPSLASKKRKAKELPTNVNLSPPKKRAIGSVDEVEDTSEGRMEKLIQNGLAEISLKLEFGLTQFHSNIIELKEDFKVLKKMVKCSSVNRENQAVFINESELPPLPLDSMEDIELIESLLKSSEQERINLVSQLSVIGGSSMRGIVNNCMNKILSRELAMKFSLHGTKDKKPFKELTIYKCALENFKSHEGCRGSTTSDLMKVIASNLAYAHDRLQKKMKRQSEQGSSGHTTNQDEET